MNVLSNLTHKYIPFLSRKRQPSREELLRSRPVRNPQLEWGPSADGETQLKIPRRQDFVGRMLSRLFRAPGHKVIVLDDIGSDVWELCDGKHSLDSIVSEICRRHKITRRECEVSVSTYLKTLGERHLIGLQRTGKAKK